MPRQEHVPWFERLIRDAEDAGEFDDLKGSGRPIEDLDRHYEAGWWAKRFMERERRSRAVIELSARIRTELPRLLAKRDDVAVRTGLEALNHDIESVNEGLDNHERLDLLDVEALMARRAHRHSSTS